MPKPNKNKIRTTPVDLQGNGTRPQIWWWQVPKPTVPRMSVVDIPNVYLAATYFIRQHLIWKASVLFCNTSKGCYPVTWPHMTLREGKTTIVLDSDFRASLTNSEDLVLPLLSQKTQQHFHLQRITANVRTQAKDLGTTQGHPWNKPAPSTCTNCSNSWGCPRFTGQHLTLGCMGNGSLGKCQCSGCWDHWPASQGH